MNPPLWFPPVAARFERLISQTGLDDWGYWWQPFGSIRYPGGLSELLLSLVTLLTPFPSNGVLWRSAGGLPGGWPIDHLGRTR